MGSGSSINAYFGVVAIVSGIRYCITQRRKGREKDNFLLFFFAALRLCVIKLAAAEGAVISSRFSTVNAAEVAPEQRPFLNM